jgi:hypothetical protein
MKNTFNKENIFIFFFFLILLITGTCLFSDYGISIDEDNSRVNGFVSLKYILELFNSSLLADLNKIISVPNIHEYLEQGNGVVFELPLALIEVLFDLDSLREIFLIRHYFTFLIFYISLIFFFLILKMRFKSLILASLGVIFLFLSPRIFAQSFYNSKDIVFMSLSIVNLFFGIKYLENSNLKNSFFFLVFSGLAVGVRLLGIYLPILICLFKYLQLLRGREKNFISLLVILLCLPFFIYIFWPYLWSDPINHFLDTFIKIGGHQVGINNFFMGNYIPVEFVPWYYSLIWISVTNPIFYIILFLIGSFFISKRMISRILKIEYTNQNNDLWRGEKEKIDVLIILNIIIPIFTIVIMHSSLYTGWRHVFFIYPSLIFMSVHALNLINTFFIKEKYKIVILSLIFLIPTLFWMYKNHPYQYVYFNSFVNNNFNKYFDMDYWGLTNYHSLEYILDKDKKDLVYVGIIGNGDLNLSKSFLTNEQKKRVVITSNVKRADYLIENYARWDGVVHQKSDLYVKKNFKKFFEIEVNKISINTIYIKNFK